MYGYNYGYQPMGYGYQPQYQPQQGGAIAFVEGDAGAAAMQVEPGKSGMAMDIKAMMVYLKSVDPAGIPSTRKFRMVEEVQQPQQAAVAYATADELRRIQDEVQRLSAAVQGLTGKEG